MSANVKGRNPSLDGRENPKPSLITSGYNLPYDPDLVPRARELRKSMTKPEKKLWDGFLRNHRLRFLRQRPVDHFIVDFYCARAKLVIELDGDPHFNPHGKGYDKERSVALEGYGLYIQRFTNSEVANKFEWVCQTIENLLHERLSDWPALKIPPSPP